MQVTNVVEPNIETSEAVSRTRGGLASFLRVLTSNPKIAFGLSVVAFFVLLAIAAPLLTPYDPNARAVPLAQNLAFAPSAQHWLGTTGQGRDVFSQLAYGGRVTLLIGFTAAIGSTILQVLFGLSAAYFGGVIDEVLTLIGNIFLVLPGLPLTIVLASVASARSASHNSWIIVLVVLFTSWSYGARVLRAQTLSLKEREFVTAARATGEKPWRIIFAEILPNEVALVASTFVGTFVYAVGAEVALEFLGLGDASSASWGTILFWAQGNNALITNHWWEFVPAGLCVAVLCASLTFINFGIDEIANPNLRSERLLKKQKKGAAA